MFKRKTSAPCFIKSRSTSGSSEAGPSVQMILVLRMTGQSSCAAVNCKVLGSGSDNIFLLPARFLHPWWKSERVTWRMKGEIRAVERIVQKLRSPSVLHGGRFPKKLRLLFPRRIVPARGGLVVDEIRIGRPDNPEPARPDAQT